VARSRPRHVVGAPPPRAPERALLRALAPMVAEVRASLPAVRSPADARRLGAALRARWTDARIRELVRAHGATIEAAGSRPWLPVVRAVDRARARPKGDALRLDAAKPYDGARLLDQWSREAASLITSVRDEVAEGLRADVVAALAAGTDPRELADRWRRKGIPVTWGTLEGRVKVIAQHQLSSLNARVQRERAGAVGVAEFSWRTQEDDVVRPAHRELNRHVYAYAHPPSEGLPGEPVNCRCWPESVIPDAMVEALNLSAIFET